MNTRQIIDDQNNRVVRITDYDFDTIERASKRLAEGGGGLSEHEFTAAAIVNGRIDLLTNADFRRAFIAMGRAWAHATIETIFDHWEHEMALPPSDPRCPVGDQRIFTGGR